MGQKVNPTGFRLPVNRAWRSRWFAPKKAFSAFLVEDQQIREYVKKRFVEAALSKIMIERYANRVRVSLISAARVRNIIGVLSRSKGIVREAQILHRSVQIRSLCNIRSNQTSGRIVLSIAFEVNKDRDIVDMVGSCLKSVGSDASIRIR